LQRAADHVFATRGLRGATVEEIAARAQVSVGSIYNNFGSKAGLYAAVVDRALDVDREYMDRAYVPGRSPIAQLRAAAEQYLRFALEHPDFFRMLAFPAPVNDAPAAVETARLLARRVDHQNARMVAALQRGMADGSIRPLDATQTATVLWASWNGIISLAWRPDELRRNARDLTALVALATDVVDHGLRAPAASPPPS
jgi:AcrR family transcriptional regulator